MIINTYLKNDISVARCFYNLVPAKVKTKTRSSRKCLCMAGSNKLIKKIEQNVWSKQIQTTSNTCIKKHSTKEVSTDQGRVIYALICLIFFKLTYVRTTKIWQMEQENMTTKQLIPNVTTYCLAGTASKEPQEQKWWPHVHRWTDVIQTFPSGWEEIILQ